MLGPVVNSPPQSSVSLSSQLCSEVHLARTLKPATVGVFTPQELVSTANQGLLVSREVTVQHLPANQQSQESASPSDFHFDLEFTLQQTI